MKNPDDYGGEPLCPRCAGGYPDCTDYDLNDVQYAHADTCGKYEWADSLCDPCDAAFRAEILPKRHTPGDRVRVTAGDLCGATGTVIGGVPHGLVEVEWDEGGEFHIDPDRLEKVDVRDAWAKATANYRRDIEVLHKAWPGIARQLNESFGRIQRIIKNTQQFLIRSGLVEPPPPEDPRERALRARENRNTGPDRSKYKHRGIK